MTKEAGKEKAPERAFFHVLSANFLPWCGADRIKFTNGLLETDNPDWIAVLRQDLKHWEKLHGLREVTKEEFDQLCMPQLPEGFEDGAIMDMPKNDFLDKLKAELGSLPGQKP